jgi:hypothetical protein
MRRERICNRALTFTDAERRVVVFDRVSGFKWY